MNIIKLMGRKAVVTTVAGLMAATSSNVSAFGFEWGDVEGSVNVLMSAGATFRAENRDYSLISKRSQPNFIGTTVAGSADILCPDDQTGGDPNAAAADDGLGGCVLSGREHHDFVLAPGSYTQNGDQGNLNYDKGDVVHAAFKTTMDIDMTWEDYGMFARVISFYDPTAVDYEESHIDVLNQAEKTMRPKSVEDDIGFSSRLEDFYVYGSWDIFDRTLSVNLGKHVVSWGESLTFVVNSVNSVNAPNVIRLNTPGLDLKELFTPTEMVSAGIDLTENLSMEAFYQLKWRPIIIPPVGDFFSTSDVAGTGSSQYAMLGFGKEPEDPGNLQDQFISGTPEHAAALGRNCINDGSHASDDLSVYDVADRDAFGNPDNPTSEIPDRLEEFGYYWAERNGDEEAGRTICRVNDMNARDDGQWGVKLNYYAAWLNDTEFGFYYSNYHSRLPYASFIATDINDDAGSHPLHAPISTLFTAFPQDPDFDDGSGGYQHSLEEDDADVLGALKRVDTAAVFLEYPEDIEMYGMSFNTTVGDLSISGEVAYRPNMPLQLSTVDATLFALSPAFGQAKDISAPSYLEAYRHAPNLTGADKAAYDDAVANGASGYDAYWGLNNNRGPNGIYINDRTGVPTTIGTPVITAGSIIPGYERFKTAHSSSTMLYATSTNPFAADQMIIIGDFNLTHVFDMPELDELQLSAPGDENWYGVGRTEMEIDPDTGAPREINVGPVSPLGIGLVALPGVAISDCRTSENVLTDSIGAQDSDCAPSLLRQTPVSEPGDTFATQSSWGFRVLSILKYNNLIFGANLNQLLGVFVDVNGNSPGPGGNFVEGRKRFLWGSEFVRGDWTMNFKYNWFTGAGDRNLENDRDTYSVDIRYSF